MGQEITSDEVAELAGVGRNTFLSYVSRKQAPQPVRHVGRTPVWDAEEIDHWLKNRPGQGDRTTDRAKRRAAERAASAEPETAD